jgi:rhamnulokinase
VIGGGSQNKYLMQYAADALNMPVICGPVEGTALGNVLMQMKASGVVDTLEQMRAISAASVDLVVYNPTV